MQLTKFSSTTFISDSTFSTSITSSPVEPVDSDYEFRGYWMIYSETANCPGKFWAMLMFNSQQFCVGDNEGIYFPGLSLEGVFFLK